MPDRRFCTPNTRELLPEYRSDDLDALEELALQIGCSIAWLGSIAVSALALAFVAWLSWPVLRGWLS